MLRNFHPDLLKWCSMHCLNLGLCFTTNGSLLRLAFRKLSGFCHMPFISVWCFAQLYSFSFFRKFAFSVLVELQDGFAGSILFRRLSAALSGKAPGFGFHAFQILVQEQQDLLQPSAIYCKDGFLSRSCFQLLRCCGILLVCC